MIAIARHPKVNQRGWRHRYLRLLPSIRRHAAQAFRHLDEEQREEAMADVVAHTFTAYRRLVEQSKEALASAQALTRFAVAHYRSGRRSGSSLNSCDVLSAARRRRVGHEVVSLEALYGDSTPLTAAWIDQRHTPIPEQVAFRIDFNEWLRRLRPRHRRLVQFFTLGNSPSEAAAELQVSRARISQLRDELYAAWLAFQGDVELAPNRGT